MTALTARSSLMNELATKLTVFDALGLMLAALAVIGALLLLIVAIRMPISISRDRVRRGQIAVHEEMRMMK